MVVKLSDVVYFFEATALEFKVTDARLEHPPKAYWPIVVTLLGIVMEVRLEHLQKAQRSILVTLLGIVTKVRSEHS